MYKISKIPRDFLRKINKRVYTVIRHLRVGFSHILYAFQKVKIMNTTNFLKHFPPKLFRPLCPLGRPSVCARELCPANQLCIGGLFDSVMSARVVELVAVVNLAKIPQIFTTRISDTKKSLSFSANVDLDGS